MQRKENTNLILFQTDIKDRAYFPSIGKITIKVKSSEIIGCRSGKKKKKIWRIMDEIEEENRRSSFFLRAKERSACFAFTILRTTLFSAPESSIRANWTKKRLESRESRIVPETNIFRPWRIALLSITDASPTRWIFSRSFELVKRTDYQTLRTTSSNRHLRKQVHRIGSRSFSLSRQLHRTAN